MMSGSSNITAILELLDFQNARSKVRAKPSTAVQYKAEVDAQFILSKPRDVSFSEEEEALLTAMIRYCLFHRLLTNESTKVFVREPFPPTGYAAIYHSLTPFDPRCYYSLFYGCAILKVKCTDVLVKEWAESLKAIIPDKSPNPPSFVKKDPVEGPWYPSLGRGGWISVNECYSIENGDISHAILLVVSLDPAIQRELHMLMILLWKKGACLQDFYLATAWFRAYIQEAKRRILFLIVNHCLSGISAPTAVVNTSTIMDPSPERHGLTIHCSRQLAERYHVMNPELLPSSFRLPSNLLMDPSPPNRVDDGMPLQEEEVNSLCATVTCQSKGIIPDIDLTFDDCIPYIHDKTHFLRLSGCCELKGKVVRISGPTHTTKVFEIAEGTTDEHLLHAYPCIAPPNPSAHPSKGVFCCSSSDNQQGFHGFLGNTPKNVYGDKSIETLRPVFVRYSSLPLYSSISTE